MTTIEDRVYSAMDGCSNEQAESIAISILAQLFAKKVHIECNNDYMLDVVHKIAIQADIYTKEHVSELAIGRVLHKKKNKL